MALSTLSHAIRRAIETYPSPPRVRPRLWRLITDEIDEGIRQRATLDGGLFPERVPPVTPTTHRW